MGTVEFLRGMGRHRKLALAGTGCVVVLAALAWLGRPRDDPVRATLEEAVRSFRDERDAAGQGGGPYEPALGVYRYRTRGSESVESLVLDTSHDYDGVSTIVLSRGHCGERERWQVLEGRWTEVEACPTGEGVAPVRVSEFHEFFGVGQEDRLACHSSPVSPRPGGRFSSVCRAKDFSVSTVTRVAGFQRVGVGGRPYEAVHLASRSRVRGANTGTASRDEWRRRSDYLLLRRTEHSEADSGRGGGTHYSERYTIELLSTRPQR